MRKIIVIGSPGAGKSTFSKRLRDRTGLPLYFLDLLYHNPDRTVISRELFDQKLKEILTMEEWIIDGNYQRTLPMRLQSCNEVFLFDLPVEQCLEGAVNRVGKPREDMPWTENEADPEFLQYIKDFPNTQLTEIYRLLKQYEAGRKITVFHSRAEAEDWLQQNETGNR